MNGPGRTGAPLAEGEGGLSDLVRERLEGVAGLRTLDPAHEEVAWWHRRTRMVLESVIEGNRGLRGALKAFDSLALGPKSRSLDAAGYREELEKAENLLRNLMGDLPGASGRREEDGSQQGSAQARMGAPMFAPANPGSIGHSHFPESRNEALVALFHLAEALETDPGLSPEERHDFRLDVRSLHQEMMKFHPDARRVIGLIETLSRFEVDLSAVRRSF